MFLMIEDNIKQVVNNAVEKSSYVQEMEIKKLRS